jgi:hypothetical protein
LDIYHVWFDLKPGTTDLEASEKLAAYLGHLRDEGKIEGWRLTRRKLGLAPEGLRDFHLMIEVKDLAQLETAFAVVAARSDPVETLHFSFNSLVTGAFFALYRDFPDSVRRRGEERF